MRGLKSVCWAKVVFGILIFNSFLSQNIWANSYLNFYKSEKDTTHFLYDFKIEKNHLYSGIENTRIEINTGLKISSNSSSPSVFSIKNPLEKIPDFWEFNVSVKGNLSSGNYIRYYLLSDESDFTINHNGYHLQIDGASGNHSYKLYKQNGSRRTLLFTSAAIPNENNEYKAHIKVSRTQEGIWAIEAYEYEKNRVQVLTTESLIQDPSFEKAMFFGGFITFTSTRRNDFTMESIEVSYIEKSGDTFPIQDEEEIPQDTMVNCVASQEVIFNELMVNPNSNTSWPNVEYVELFNNTNREIKIKNWTISNKSTTSLIEEAVIPAQGYLLLIKQADSLHFNSEKLNIHLLKTWPALTNTGNTLTLKCSDSNIIDTVSYSESWYTNVKDKQGGKSLEKIYFTERCYISPGWGTSTHEFGGTPGAKNSIQIDSLLDYEIQKFTLDSSRIKLEIILNKLIYPIQDTLKFHLTDKNGNSIIISSVEILENSIYLKWAVPLDMGMTYTLKSTNILSCLGESFNLEYQFNINRDLNWNDLIITEVLFNPYPDGVDFIEIFNKTQFPIDLSEIYLANINSQNLPSNLKQLKNEPYFILPQQYKVITTDHIKTIYHYPTAKVESFIELSSLPSYPNTEGRVLIMHKNEWGNYKLIDSLYYNESMHHSFIKNIKGISLERANNEIGTNEIGNFISTSLRYNGATPGYKGIPEILSEVDNLYLNKKMWNITQSEVPLKIEYAFIERDMVIHIELINFQGKTMKIITNKQPINSSGEIVIQKSDLSNLNIKTGLYTFHIEVFNNKGWKKNYKKSIIFVN